MAATASNPLSCSEGRSATRADTGRGPSGPTAPLWSGATRHRPARSAGRPAPPRRARATAAGCPRPPQEGPLGPGLDRSTQRQSRTPARSRRRDRGARRLAASSCPIRRTTSGSPSGAELVRTRVPGRRPRVVQSQDRGEVEPVDVVHDEQRVAAGPVRSRAGAHGRRPACGSRSTVREYRQERGEGLEGDPSGQGLPCDGATAVPPRSAAHPAAQRGRLPIPAPTRSSTDCGRPPGPQAGRAARCGRRMAIRRPCGNLPATWPLARPVTGSLGSER